MKGFLPKSLSVAVILALALAYTMPAMACKGASCCGQSKAGHCSTADAAEVSASEGCCDISAPSSAPDALAGAEAAANAQAPSLHPAASHAVVGVTGGEGSRTGRDHVPRGLSRVPAYKLTSSYLC